MAAVLKLDASSALALASSGSGTSSGIMLKTIGLATAERPVYRALTSDYSPSLGTGPNR
jgi:hypothetical protein